MTAPTMTERDFQSQVLDLARICGWKAYHSWTSIHSAPGFPDLVLARPPRLLFLELKSERGRLTPAQSEWLQTLAECNVDARVVRPSNFNELLEALR